MKHRVLIVDDSIESRLILEQKMLIDGFEVESTDNGMDGIAKAKEFRPDIILLDVMMAKMDGYETCRRLKKDDSTQYIPVIMLTAKGELEDKVMGLEIGAEDYIVKPYSLVEVSARVKSLLRMRAMQTKLSETDKLSSLGAMVDGIAHELRNPLVTIGGLAKRLYEHETDPEHKLYAKTIADSALRMELMLKRIDEYKGVLVSHFKIGNINDAVNQAISEFKRLLTGTGAQFAAELMPLPPPVSLDAGNLKIAVFNVLQNAFEAIEGNGKITVRTSIEKDRKLYLSVEDDGVGIDEVLVKDIFNPFHTSKIIGAGMGLTIARKIADDHGAIIEVESKKGVGTKVTFKFSVLSAVTF